MALPERALGNQTFNRRRILLGAAGLASVALVGCGGNDKPNTNNTSQFPSSIDTSGINVTPAPTPNVNQGVNNPTKTPDKIPTPKTPPMGYQAFRSTYFAYEDFSPSDCRYINQGRDIFMLPNSSSADIEIYPMALGNPAATVDDFVQRNLSELRSVGLDASIITPSSPSSNIIQQKLVELAGIKMDNRDTRLIFSRPTNPQSIYNMTSASAFIVKNGQAWLITGGDTNPNTASVNMPLILDRMKVMMESFHLLA